MSNLTVRILTAVIAGTAVVAGIWFSPWGLFIFCVALSVLGILEFYKITGVRWWPAYAVAGLFALLVWSGLGLLLTAAVHKKFIATLDSDAVSSFLYYIVLSRPVNHILVLWVAFMFILLMASLFRKAQTDPVKDAALYFMGYFYAFLPFVLFFSLHIRSFMESEGDPEKITYRYIALGILFLFWTLDSFAYFGGRLFGKHKLFERISPKKTWEGSIIGAAFCIGLGVLFQFVWPVGWNWIVVAAIISVTGQLGDLVESMFKRSLALKDSGGLLPGHGGILDRFDGFIISMPFIALYHLLTQWFS